MRSEQYKGWKNRETWACFVAISNTEHLYKRATKYRLNAEGLRGMLDDVACGVASGINTESIPLLLSIGSLDRVDFAAIAKALNEDSEYVCSQCELGFHDRCRGKGCQCPNEVHQ